MLCLCIMYMVSSWHFRSCLGSAWRGEDGEPQQFLVRASSKFSSFQLIEMLFCRTSFIGYIHYFTNLKIVWENFVFYFCAEVAIFSKNIFICKGWTLKKKYWKDEDFEVAWTRKWGECGSDEILLWLVFLLSLDP